MPGHCGRIKDEKCESVGDRHSGTCTSRCSDTQGSFSFCKLQSSKSQILDCETHASSGAELTIQERRRTGKAEAGGKSSEPRGEVLCRRKSLKMLAAVGGKVLGQCLGTGSSPRGQARWVLWGHRIERCMEKEERKHREMLTLWFPGSEFHSPES